MVWFAGCRVLLQGAGFSLKRAGVRFARGRDFVSRV
jgi:hypothetical protein